MNHRFLFLCLPGVLLGITGCDIQAPTSGEELAGGNIVRVSMGQSNTSAFVVVRGDGTFALVDTAEAPGEGEAHPIEEALADLGGSVDDVTDVFFTHGHGDHIGGASLFEEADFHSLAAEIPIIEGKENPERPLPSGEPEPTGVLIDFILEDEERIAVGDRSLQVFALPGHTKGSAVYLIDGVLLLGDAGYVSSEGEMTGATWVFSTDTEENDASLKALVIRLDELELEVDALAPAHSASSLDGLIPLRRYVDAL